MDKKPFTVADAARITWEMMNDPDADLYDLLRERPSDEYPLLQIEWDRQNG